REVDKKLYNPSDIERFDYFYQFTFKFPPGNNLDSLLIKFYHLPIGRPYRMRKRFQFHMLKMFLKNIVKKLEKHNIFLKSPTHTPCSILIWRKEFKQPVESF